MHCTRWPAGGVSAGVASCGRHCIGKGAATAPGIEPALRGRLGRGATGVGGAVVFRNGRFRDGYGRTVKSGRYLRARERARSAVGVGA